MSVDRFEMLFTHNVDGVFFMTFDEPIRWNATADREALLDYAFDHLRITAVNPQMCHQLGAPREQLLGSVPRDRWEGAQELWRHHIRRLFDMGREYVCTRAPKNDGDWYDAEGEYVCLYDDEGRITGYFGTQRDVTEKRKIAERLELAMVGGEIGIWDYDLVKHEIYIDARWLARLGYSDSVGALDPLWWSSHIHRADVAAATNAFEAHLAGATDFYRVEYRLRGVKDKWYWVMSNGRVSSRDSDGRPLRVIGSLVDITDRKRLQERLVLSERMASIGTLAAGVGHEINNPLTYIALNLELIERELKALDVPGDKLARVREMIVQARYGTERASSIVRDLQVLTRVREEKIESVDLVAVVERCLEIADHQVRNRARVIRDLAAVPAVLGSERRVIQLLLHLIMNAGQAIPEGAVQRHWVRVATRTAGEQVIVEVADNGVGIMPDVLPRIFDPFFTTKEVGEGTGLGLTISRSIITAMEGEIEVDSTPGVGTTIRVVLPAVPNDVAISKPAAATVRPLLRVLVMDDEPMVVQLVAKALSEHIISVESSARAALAKLRAGEHFDRILCDIMMPELNGVDFYEELGAIDATLQARVVFLSTGELPEHVRAFLARVPNRRLIKPFAIEELAAVLIH